MKKEIRLYNVILPIWLLLVWPVPPMILLTIFGNLAVDCLVLFLALCALKHADKGQVVKQLWWKLWLLGFAADGVGLVWMFLGWLFPTLMGAENTALGRFWDDTIIHIMHNAFAHPLALLWALIGIAIAGMCIYLFDKRAMRSCGLLSEKEKRTVALTMAIVTAPWLFLVPSYL